MSAAHLAGTGSLRVQSADEGPHSDGQRVIKNRQLGLKKHNTAEKRVNSTVNLSVLQGTTSPGRKVIIGVFIFLWVQSVFY